MNYVAVVIALVFGMVIGRFTLGYSSAEECAVRAQTRIGAASCFELYPRVASLR
ncbi:hypothetical protein M0D69_14055 [Caballeronia sp. SEWSISQ10-4 2]|uniref:hypothetical protein n=1 Tax=Caballeronia sp. SEWSISQ10-4 2 TaxID=2937438 RepID=UPI0026528305|nr:hypothetical protein [Caballeronia sp. SEWSISQ10-4 2]MDN7179118.1 hypothetical protein [Caballeronia sp. SEWSISQ10-4 2]